MFDKTEANARRRVEMERDECSEAYENLRAENERLRTECDKWHADYGRLLNEKDAEVRQAEKDALEWQAVAHLGEQGETTLEADNERLRAALEALANSASTEGDRTFARQALNQR